MRIISFFIFLFSFLNADVKIFAKNLVKKDGVYLIDRPVIVSNDKIIEANKGIIKNKIITLDGNVSVFYKNSSTLFTPRLKVLSKKKYRFFKYIFL